MAAAMQEGMSKVKDDNVGTMGYDCSEYLGV